MPDADCTPGRELRSVAASYIMLARLVVSYFIVQRWYQVKLLAEDI